jgi:hypothetical protein
VGPRRRASASRFGPRTAAQTIHFIRHGEGFHNVAGRADHDAYKSWDYEDAHLTDYGWQQARLEQRRHPTLAAPTHRRASLSLSRCLPPWQPPHTALSVSPLSASPAGAPGAGAHQAHGAAGGPGGHLPADARPRNCGGLLWQPRRRPLHLRWAAAPGRPGASALQARQCVVVFWGHGGGTVKHAQQGGVHCCYGVVQRLLCACLTAAVLLPGTWPPCRPAATDGGADGPAGQAGRPPSRVGRGRAALCRARAVQVGAHCMAGVKPAWRLNCWARGCLGTKLRVWVHAARTEPGRGGVV